MFFRMAFISSNLFNPLDYKLNIAFKIPNSINNKVTKRRTVNILFKLLFFACCRTGLNKIKTRPSKLVIKNRGIDLHSSKIKGY